MRSQRQEDDISARFTVSVIIPVYNAAAHLDECLESLVAQTLGFDRIEVVAVDDGSTDGSGKLLDGWAERHPDNIRVLHQPNSGAPGGPRNRAIDQARGEFLFFADPDDHLGTEALARMVALAERAGSDVVLGRIKGVGRSAPKAAFARGVERGDIHTTGAVWSLTAHKLFRRSLVTEHGLRFAEGVRLAEEQPFVVPAYFLARAISVVADYDCYYLVNRDAEGDGGSHLTQQVPDPVSFYGAVRQALEAVVRHTEPGEARNRLLHRWARLEILAKFGPRFAGWTPQRRAAWTRHAGALVADFLPPELIAELPPPQRLRARMLREGRMAELTRLARHEDLEWAEQSGLSWLADGRRCAVRVDSPLHLDDAADLRYAVVLRHEDGHEVAVPLAHTAGKGPLTRRVVLDPLALHRVLCQAGLWRVRLRLATPESGRGLEVPLRLPAGPAGGPVAVPDVARVRSLRVHGTRLLLVRLSRRGQDAVFVAGDWRHGVRALGRGARRTPVGRWLGEARGGGR